MKKDDNIVAGIVLYNPDIHRLQENIESIRKQVGRVILVNNGSKNTENILGLIKTYRNCEYIDLKENLGIAMALNIIVNKVKEKDCSWVLTLDQDTVCSENIIANYKKYLSLDNVGQLTCSYQDRNFSPVISENNDSIEEVEWCITSAALVSVEAWESIGGADERLFIDAVDLDICFSMREKGYKIYKCDFVGFLHEIGNGKTIKIGPLKIKTWNHSAFRRFYSARNAMIVARKHKSISTFHTFLGTMKHIIIIFIFEDDKWNKLKNGIKGMILGMFM